MLHHIEKEEIPKVIPAGWMAIPGAGAIGTKLDSGLAVLMSYTTMRDGSRWVHISMSRKDRYPSWTEMRAYLDGTPFLNHDKEIKMVIPPAKEYVNLHPFCFHWWQERED